MIKNSKKGFTLVELLAVMSVLAIIALIAVPVVTDTIRKAKDKASLVNAELYLKAAHEAILEYKLEDEDRFYPETCTVNGKDLICDNVTIKVKVKGNPPDSGTIIYKNEEISRVDFKYGTKKIKNNLEGILVFDNSICTYDIHSIIDENMIGAKYSCEVKPGTNYTFFILSKNEDGTANLIMERNICEDGSVATNQNKCSTEWMSKADYNDNANYGADGNTDKGPVTAMNYLHNATKDWENVPNIVINYTNEANTYGTIITSGSKTKITKKDKTTVTVSYDDLKARLPYKNEVNATGCLDGQDNSCPAWMINYLNASNDKCEISINGIHGYWTYDTDNNKNDLAWDVYSLGCSVKSSVDNEYYPKGVRPVITLKLQ